MKGRILVCMGLSATMIALSSLECHAASDCGDAPRVISPFGAENPAPAPVALPKGIQVQLRGKALVRQVLNTHLSPAGEEVIVYDSDEDESDPHPVVAFVVGDRVTESLDANQMIDWGGGFVRFQTGCPYQLDGHQEALALAFTTAFDGTGSVFEVIVWRSGKYRVAFTTHGSQSQLRISPNGMTLLTSIGDGECVWCSQHYRITRFTMTNGQYRRSGAGKLKRSQYPGDVSGRPLVIMSSHSQSDPR